MEHPSPWQALKERIHAAREEDRAGPERERLEQVLLGMNEGLYPVCAKCGERIEMERLLKDPAEMHCWSCVAHAAPKKECCAG